MNSFKIESVSRLSSELVQVMVTMSAKEWTSIVKQGALDQLYGIDISNQVFREHGVKAFNPTVDDQRKPKKGSVTKTIELTYVDSEWLEPMGELIQVDFINRRRVA